MLETTNQLEPLFQGNLTTFFLWLTYPPLKKTRRIGIIIQFLLGKS